MLTSNRVERPELHECSIVNAFAINIIEDQTRRNHVISNAFEVECSGRPFEAQWGIGSLRRPLEWTAGTVRGIVKWFDNSKGYGFIGRDDGPDVFVHFSAVIGDGYRSLQEGDAVEFEIGAGPQGPQAMDVKKIE